METDNELRAWRTAQRVGIVVVALGVMFCVSRLVASEWAQAIAAALGISPVTLGVMFVVETWLSRRHHHLEVATDQREPQPQPS